VAGDPRRLELGEVDAEHGLVVGDEGDRVAVMLEPKADRRAGMRDREREDADAVELPGVVRHVVKPHLCGDVAEVDGEQGRRERPGDAFLERVDGRRRSQMCTCPSSRHSGETKRSPSTWSRCRCERSPFASEMKVAVESCDASSRAMISARCL
jgi:hypothetical protein